MSSSHSSQIRCLTPFSPQVFPEIRQDRSEKISNLCLWGLYKTFKITKITGFYPPTVEKINCLARFLFGLMTFTILLPLTIIGLITHRCSQSRKKRRAEYVKYLTLQSLNINKPQSPKDTPPITIPAPTPISQNLANATLNPPDTAPEKTYQIDEILSGIALEEIQQDKLKITEENTQKVIDKLKDINCIQKNFITPTLSLTHLFNNDDAIPIEKILAGLEEILPKLKELTGIYFPTPIPDNRKRAPSKYTYNHYFQIISKILDMLTQLNPLEKEPVFSLKFCEDSDILSFKCFLQYLTPERFQTLIGFISPLPNWWHSTLNACLLRISGAWLCAEVNEKEGEWMHANCKSAIKKLTDQDIINCMFYDKCQNHAGDRSQQMISSWVVWLSANAPERIESIIKSLLSNENRKEFFEKIQTSIISLFGVNQRTSGRVSCFFKEAMPLIGADHIILSALIPISTENSSYLFILFELMSKDQFDYYVQNFAIEYFDHWQAACLLGLASPRTQAEHLTCILDALAILLGSEIHEKPGKDWFIKAVVSLQEFTKSEEDSVNTALSDAIVFDIEEKDDASILRLAVIAKKLNRSRLLFNSLNDKQFRSVLDDLHNTCLAAEGSASLSPVKETYEACLDLVQQLAYSTELSAEEFASLMSKFQALLDFLQDLLLKISEEGDSANHSSSFILFKKIIKHLDVALCRDFASICLKENFGSEVNPLGRMRLSLDWKNSQVGEYITFIRNGFATIFKECQTAAKHSPSLKRALYSNIPIFFGPIALKSLYAQCHTPTELFEILKEDALAKFKVDNTSKDGVMMILNFANSIGGEMSVSAFDRMSEFLKMTGIAIENIKSFFDDQDDASEYKNYRPYLIEPICVYYVNYILTSSLGESEKMQQLVDFINRPFLCSEKEWRIRDCKEPIEVIENFGYFIGQLNLPSNIILAACARVDSSERHKDFVTGYVQGLLKKGDVKEINSVLEKIVNLFKGNNEFLIKINKKLTLFKKHRKN